MVHHVGSAHHGRLGVLLLRALAVPPERRPAFLSGVCGDDAALRDDLVSLLSAHDTASDYFDRLSAGVVAPALTALAGGSPAGSAPDMLDTLRAQLAGTYQIERELAGGGMSRVFVAEDVSLGRRVVIKVLPREMAVAASAVQFRREIEVAARLQHPHIVPLLTADSVDDLLYYTMPLVTGVPLDDRLAREGALPIEDALRIWRDVLDALAYAHAHRVVHRDIKPGNILLNGRHALVTDFGIARAIETAAGDVVTVTPILGTPAYMAPEEAAGSAASDQRVDIYGAALVMYEMLAGRPPFVADTAPEYLEAHRTRPPPPLLRSDAPPALLELVMRCLAKDPARRPPSAEVVLAALDPGIGEKVRLFGAGARPWRRLAPYGVVALALAATVPAAMRARADPPTAAGARLETSAIAAPALADPGIEPPPDELADGGAGTTAAPRPGLATSHIAAYEWYLRSMDVSLLRTDGGTLQGVEYLKRAIALDSTFVDAWAGLSRKYVQLANAAPGPARAEWLERAREAARTAIALDDRDADARTAMGWVHLVAREFPAALTELELAVALDPVVPRGREGLARAYMMTGRPEEQLAEARLAVRADPFSYSAIRELALALATNGRCEESLEPLRSLKNLTPPAGVAGVIRGLCYASRQMWPEAIAEFRWAADNTATAAVSLLGHALARAGRHDEAASILSDLVAGRAYSHGASGVATVYAGMRDYDQAFAWLDRAVDDGTMTFYIMHPLFDDLHRDSRFDRIRERLGARGR